MKKTRVTDMTTGSPIRHILRFTFPLLIGNIFQQFYNMVDSLVVGNYVGKNALAAVGACGSIGFLFFALTSGLATGTGVIVSQYFGAKDDKHVKSTIANSFYVLALTSLVVAVLAICLAPILLRLLGTPLPVISDAILYLRVTCAGILATALYNGVASILRALGDSRTPLYFLIVSSVVNVMLDFCFVVGFGWGVFGVAFATVIAQIVSATTCIVYAFKKVEYFRLKREDLRPDRKIILSSYRLGVPLSLQSSMIAISCMALQGVVNSFGENVMAANTIISRIEQIVQQGFTSLSSALTVFAGQNIGAGKIQRIKKGFRQTNVVTLIFSLVLIPVMYLFGADIVALFVKEQAVIDIGAGALKMTSVFYFALGMIYMPRALLNGCGDTGFAMINGVTEVICRVAFSQIFIRIPIFGFWSVWATTIATWIVTAVVCIIRYFQGKWKHKSIVSG